MTRRADALLRTQDKLFDAFEDAVSLTVKANFNQEYMARAFANIGTLASAYVTLGEKTGQLDTGRLETIWTTLGTIFEQAEGIARGHRSMSGSNEANKALAVLAAAMVHVDNVLPKEEPIARVA